MQLHILVFFAMVTLGSGVLLSTVARVPKITQEFLPNKEISNDDDLSRTFGIGARRKMQMFLLPIMFKLGVIMTLLVGLTVLVFKSLAIGVILLVIAFSGLFSKVKLGGYHHAEPIQVHLHGTGGPYHHYPPAPEHISDWNRKGPHVNAYRH